MNFDSSLDAPYGIEIRLSPLVSRVLAPNPGPFTFKGSGTYLVGAGAAVAMIDPGPDMPEHVAAIQRVLAGRRISHILVTHTHRDHSPAAASVKTWANTKTYALAAAAPPAAGEGAADEAHDHDFVPDIQLRDGQKIVGDGFGITCVATPGHTANHVCYALAGEKALFSGDHVMGWSTSVIAPPDGDMGQYMESLETLAMRDDDILYPTHGSPIRQPRSWLQGLIAHRQQREAQILEALALGPLKIPALARTLYPDIDTRLFAAAALQVRAHLEYARARGLAEEAGSGWIRSGNA